jgi:uncharacterized Zn finger protein
MSFWSFRPYVPVAARRKEAAREVEKLKKKGHAVSPVVIEGRTIARSLWGKAWCDNLERYSDFENRLPRGRSYVRNGFVIDLKIARGQVEALVSGSEIYQIKIDIKVAAPSRWQAICQDCAGSVGSLVELLQGRLSKSVMERMCRKGDGLFPAPPEIKMSCSCPDWADMYKHVAAVLYGVGARLDASPELLFILRGVDHADLVSHAGAGLPSGAGSTRILADDDVAALLGLDMAAAQETPVDALASKAGRQSKAKPAASKTKSPAAALLQPAKGPKARSRASGTELPSPMAELDAAVTAAAKRAAKMSPAVIATVPETTRPAGTKTSAKSSACSPAKRPKTASSTAAEKDQAAAKRPTKPQAKAASTEHAEPKTKTKAAPVSGRDDTTGRTRAARWIGARARR